ncbi:glutamyl-tRNA reductase [Elongatibacter sediminis]|uniref:Glutamyl-tRNA reductase n=1 Tax=Elongatibacter sediminis TaxID=3119006 RepID=A0AAW9RBR1_9GAMM
MPLFTLGISHHTAPVEVREQVAIAPSDYGARVRELIALPAVEEALILGTCNRTEVFCLASGEAEDAVLKWVHRINGLPANTLDAHFYHHGLEETVRHVIRVAGGLDSLVLGEPQILGQLKEAWHAAREVGGVNRVLDRLFQHAFAAAKSIRTQSGIGSRPVSVAYTAVILARQIFGDLSSQNVVLIGAGDMIRLCGQHLRESGIRNIEIVNRSRESATELAEQLDARVSVLDQLPEVLPRADILISSTASPVHLIGSDDAKAALRQRRHRPMFMVDIAVPRDIDPAVGRLDDVYLYSIDDLQQVVDENVRHRSQAAEAASSAVDDATQDFLRWLYGIRAARSLKRIRDRAHGHEEDLVARAVRRLRAGHDPERVLTQLAGTLTNRILHEPSQHLRQAAEQQRYEILQAADWLFRGGDEAAETNDTDNSDPS